MTARRRRKDREMNELKPCPFCGENDISMGAFSISPDCYIECGCGARIELQIPWNDLHEEEHDAICAEKLIEAWNRRADNV